MYRYNGNFHEVYTGTYTSWGQIFLNLNCSYKYFEISTTGENLQSANSLKLLSQMVVRLWVVYDRIIMKILRGTQVRFTILEGRTLTVGCTVAVEHTTITFWLK